ncbi:RNA polymerase III C11 subunit [Exophiala xenobiotica]|uniref:RNA polymerase III C11 subunit n=1 Tax=Lithohypha guttulata TaxID=1690604 RepID=A0ABR0JXH3_9EURO|nr:RNA polymerase III C11 subunit [Lithohypha guttulata]KAK5310179.1 RNA polymerase III C11 subunit [Exophiala xenobiotica]
MSRLTAQSLRNSTPYHEHSDLVHLLEIFYADTLNWLAMPPTSTQDSQGRNAFTCRTCPYQFVLDQPYYERTYMKKKQQDDIMGEGQTDLPINEGTRDAV